MKKTSYIVLIFLISCSEKHPYIRTGMEGSPLPEFNLQLANNSYLNSKHIPDNKTIILFYFSPHCPYCRATLKDILNHDALFSHSFIYMITSANLNSMRNFITEFKLDQVENIKVGIDYKYFLGNYFSIKRVPYLAVYNEKRRLIAQLPGSVSAMALKTFTN